MTDSTYSPILQRSKSKPSEPEPPQLCASCKEEEPMEHSIMCKACKALAEELIGDVVRYSDAVAIRGIGSTWVIGNSV